MAKEWTRRTPFARLIFHTKQRRPFSIGGDEARDINATENIVSITTSNSLRQGAGNFSIDLIYRPGKDRQPLYYEAINPLDLVDIWLDRTGTTMIGIIDSVSKRTTISGQGPQRRVTIVGRSLAAVWFFDLIKYFPFATGLPEELKDRNLELMLGAIKLDFYMKSAVFAIETLYQRLPALEIKLKDSVLKDFINVGDELYVRDGEVVYNLGLSGYQGAVFDYFRKYIGAPFNELWTDSRDGKLYLRLRPTPFSMPGDEESVEYPKGRSHVSDYSWSSRETWTWITNESYHQITPDMVRDEQLAKSHAKAYSIFIVLPSDPLVAADGRFSVFPPLIEHSLYRAVGSRDYSITIDYIPVTREHEQGLGALEKFKFYRNKLYLWNKDNHKMEQGSMTIRGDSRIRVGDKVLRTDTQKTYYVESVQNRWDFGRPMTTTLGVSRGATEKNRKDWYRDGLNYLREAAEA